MTLHYSPQAWPGGFDQGTTLQEWMTARLPEPERFHPLMMHSCCYNINIVYSMHGKMLITVLKEKGWLLDRIRGSHHIMVKEGRRAIPVPVHGSKDLPRGLVKTILNQAEREEGMK